MKTSARLLMISILGVVLVAPPAYPQNTQKDQLSRMELDLISLKASLKLLQESSDQKNAEIAKLMQEMMKEVLTRFGAIDGTVKRLNDSLNSLSQAQTGLKANDAKSEKQVQEVLAGLETLKKNVDEGFLAVSNQFRGVRQQLNDMKSEEQQLPSAAQVFSQAFGDLNSGNYELAIAGLTDFLKNYPNDERKDDAAFYIGEAYFQQKKWEEARVQFDLLLQTYPDSDKKCTALYRKGRILAEQKQIPDARTVLTTVRKECPGTQEAVNAQSDLKTLPAK